MKIFIFRGGSNLNRKRTRALASTTLISLVLSTSTLATNPVYAAEGRVTRISGADRYETAAQVATTNWSYGTENVVLVSGEGYADAVSASSLAKQLNAPILLTNSNTLNSDAKSALDTLKPNNIYVIGGNASISQGVRTTLRNYGYNLIELQGINRYETNVAVAKKMVELGVSAENVILASGEGFSDALSVAPVAAAKGQILLLGSNDSSSMQSTINFVKANNSQVTVVGTSNVISDYIYNLLNAVERVNGGANRFETNVNVLNKFDSSLKSDKLYIANASGDGYADALVASALAGKTDAPLVLVDNYGSSGTNNALSYIRSKATEETDLNVIGGSGVVSESTVYDINNIISQKGSSNSNTSDTVKSIETISLNQMKIHFNTSVDEDSAEDVTNYKIDGTQLTKLDDGVADDENGASATKIDDNTVVITFAHPRKQYDDVTITVKKGILTEDKDNSIDGFEQDVTFSDTTPPELKKVSVEGNSQLTVEFSEAVNMKSISELKSKFKVDGQSLGNYGVNTEYSEIKDGLKINSSSYGPTGTWANKVTFYLDSPIEEGNHTLKISDGDSNGLLSDAAGFTFREESQDFDVDDMSTKPTVRSVKEVSSGKIYITFDRPMDIQTAKDLSNYQVNGRKLSNISGAYIETDDNDTVIKLKHVSDGTIETGSNTLYISDHVKDAYGNRVSDDTRVNFEDEKDETKPTVESVSIVDSETIRVRFSKDVDYSYATNISNYKLEDNKDTDITDHIKEIYSTSGESDTSDTDTYNIKLYKYNPDDSDDDWRLTGSKYTLSIENIIDTSSSPNTMEDYSETISGNDDVAPRGVGIYAKLRDVSDTNKDSVIIYFSEPMDASTITDKSNYKFINGEGDTKSLPSDTEISTGGDDKSAIIEFPSSYHVKTTGKTTNGSANDVTAVSVFNVKDEEGNVLDGVAYNNDNKIDQAVSGAKVKAKTMRVYYDDDDLKVDIKFDRSISEITPSDFTLGGIKPSTANINGDKVILIYKEGAKATSDEKAAHSITYANGKINDDPTKIELVKAQGQDAKLEIVSTGTIDETGARVSRDSNGNVADLSYDQETIYDYDAAPRTTCSDDSDADYWTATKDSNGTKVYITFDTPLDPNSGTKTDDFTFVGSNGTDIKPDSLRVDGSTLIFTFDSDNKDYKAFNGGTIDIRAKSSVSLRTKKDADGEYAEYEPSSDDIRRRTITITESDTPVTPTGQVDLSTVAVNTSAVPFSTVVTFKLNVTDPANYNVKVKGVDAIFNASTNTFAATVDGTYTAVQFTSSDFVPTKKTTSGQVDTSSIAVNTAVVPFSTVVTFKLNVTDPASYSVKVKGIDAIFNASTNTFAATVDGTYTAAQFMSSDFVLTKKTTSGNSTNTTSSTLEGAALVDALGYENNGKTQFSLNGVTKVNPSDTFKYTISTTGNAVATPNVGDDLSAWTTVTDGNTVTIANGVHIGIAEVNSYGKVVKFVDKTAVVKDYTAATSGKIAAGNVVDLTTTMTNKTGSLVIKINGIDEAHTFTLSLDNHAAFYDVNSLASSIGLAQNSIAISLNDVANVTITNGKLVITSKSTGTTSTVSVSASGTNAADVLKLTGFTSSEVVTGTTEAN